MQNNMNNRPNNSANIQQGGKRNDNKKYKKHKNNNKKKQSDKPKYVPPYDKAVLEKSVGDIGLSEQTTAVLMAGGIDTVYKICERMACEMYFIQHFGKKQLNEVSQVLKKLGVDFRVSAESSLAENKEQAKENSRNDKNMVKADKGQGKSDKKEVKLEKTQPKSEKAQQRVEKTQEKVAEKAPNKAESKKENNNQTNHLESKKTKDGAFDVHKIFPKPPFVPTPSVTREGDRFVKFQRGGKWGFKDKNGKEVIPPIYDEVFNFKEDVACVERKELFGYITRDNEMIIPYKYEWASSFSEGLACVGDDSKCGYINKQGEVVIPFIFDAGTPFVGGVAQVKQNGRWGTYCLQTKEVDWTN